MSLFPAVSLILSSTYLGGKEGIYLSGPRGTSSNHKQKDMRALINSYFSNQPVLQRALPVPGVIKLIITYKIHAKYATNDIWWLRKSYVFIIFIIFSC